MADAKRQRHGAIQDTGNPVLDSTINLLMNWPCDLGLHIEDLPKIHEAVADLYEKEPKRANPPERKSIAQMQRDAQAAEARPR